MVAAGRRGVLPGVVLLLAGRAYYSYMWWGFARPDGGYDFAAAGDKGQFVYVSPGRGLAVGRFGTEYGLSMREWLGLFYRFAERYQP
jgi:hypothetical protein